MGKHRSGEEKNHRSKRNVVSWLQTKALAKARIFSKGWNFFISGLHREDSNEHLGSLRIQKMCKRAVVVD